MKFNSVYWPSNKQQITKKTLRIGVSSPNMHSSSSACTGVAARFDQWLGSCSPKPPPLHGKVIECWKDGNCNTLSVLGSPCFHGIYRRKAVVSIAKKVKTVFWSQNLLSFWGMFSLTTVGGYMLWCTHLGSPTKNSWGGCLLYIIDGHGPLPPPHAVPGTTTGPMAKC